MTMHTGGLPAWSQPPLPLMHANTIAPAHSIVKRRARERTGIPAGRALSVGGAGQVAVCDGLGWAHWRGQREVQTTGAAQPRGSGRALDVVAM